MDQGREKLFSIIERDEILTYNQLLSNYDFFLYLYTSDDMSCITDRFIFEEWDFVFRPYFPDISSALFINFLV